MLIVEAKSAGFCYGVKNAVKCAQDLVDSGRPCVMLGQIIHNADVVSSLEKQGMKLITSTDEVMAGVSVLIRSHGEKESIIKEIEARGGLVQNATCPNVLHIQKIVKEASKSGRIPIIFGEKNHPEVVAIAGYATNVVVIGSLDEARSWVSYHQEMLEQPMTLVSQTTAIRSSMELVADFLKNQCTNLIIYDTICNATHMRQKEAKEISLNVDAMVVVGDRNSANTKHLYEICLESCKKVLLVSSADELDLKALSGCITVGITAGASTPDSTIKEVKNKMTEEMKVAESMGESFAEMLEQFDKTLTTGQVVTGIVTDINSSEVIVDLGTKQPGYIKFEDLTSDPSVKPEDVVKVGDEIEAYVMRVSDVDGVAMLSKKRLDQSKIWDVIENYKEEKTVVEGTVTEINKGGLVVNVKGARVFVPASQSGKPKDADLNDMLKQNVSLRIRDVNRIRRRVVGSIRDAVVEARNAAQNAVWETIEVGKRYTGTVKSLTSYGVFVDIGGVDGMVHISELSWSRIKHPSEVVKVGDSLDVYVLAADPEKHKISLGVKDKSVQPWDVFMSQYKVGDIANVRIVKLMQFGAFAEIVPGVDGLIHISQLSNHRVEKPADAVKEGEFVDAQIIAIDEENKKVSLSIRALLKVEETSEEAEAEETKED